MVSMVTPYDGSLYMGTLILVLTGVRQTRQGARLERI